MKRIYKRGEHKRQPGGTVSLNKLLLIGNLGKDVELKYTAGGKAVATFSLATSEKYKGTEKTTWHNIVVWDKLAELCNTYLSKGRPCYVEGAISHREWEDKQGQKRTTTEVNARVVNFLSSGQTANAPVEETSFVADDVPY